MPSRVLALVDHAHTPPSFSMMLVVRDGLASHWRESYVCETNKSIKASGSDAVKSLVQLRFAKLCVLRVLTLTISS
jgi:hypothetical protein